MPPKLTSLKVSPIPNSPMHYYVQSESQPDSPHEVHLENYGGNGECSCIDWTMVCQKNIKENPGKFIDYRIAGALNPNRTRCRHCMVAIKCWADHVLKAVSMELRGK